jgi:hypothetical protein
MKKSEIEDLKTCTELLNQLSKIVDKHDSLNKCIDSENSCDCDDEEDDEDETPIIKSLQEDHDAFMKWCFGADNCVAFKKSKAQRMWKKLHPNLPLPRVLKAEKYLRPELTSIALFMDAYGYYLAFKEGSE